MPQLPSGRHTAIHPDPLFKLFDQAAHGVFVNVLMQIEDESHLLPLLEVLELVPTEGSGDAEFNPSSVARPSRGCSE